MILQLQKSRREVIRGGSRDLAKSLGNVTRDELRHLEHRDLALATKHRLQLVVGIDLGPDLFVLKTVLLDIGPKLLGELCAG